MTGVAVRWGSAGKGGSRGASARLGTVAVAGQPGSGGIRPPVEGHRLVWGRWRLAGASEEAQRVGVEQLAERGVGLEAWRGWLSEGRPTYRALLERLNLHHLPRQRGLCHRWRNVRGGGHAYAEANGQDAAAALKAAIRAVWDAPSERAAVVALVVVARR